MYTKEKCLENQFVLKLEFCCAMQCLYEYFSSGSQEMCLN